MIWSRKPAAAPLSRDQQDILAMQARSERARQIGGEDLPAARPPGLIERLTLTAASYFLERRAIGTGDIPWPGNWGTGGDLSTGGTPSAARALRLGPVYSAVALIADLISCLPLHSYRNIGDQHIPMPSLPQLFDAPSVVGTLQEWVHRCITSLALWGNAYGFVTEVDGYGYPTSIEWLDPSECDVWDTAPSGPGSFQNPIFSWRGAVIPKDRMVHIPWFTMPLKVKGLSPIASYAGAVTTGLAAQDYASGWFDSGGVPPGTMKNTRQVLDQKTSDDIKSRVMAAIRSRQPMVYGADWDYTPIAIPPHEAKFVETMRLTATQIAAIYRILQPEMIGGDSGRSMTYANVEQNLTNLVMITLLPWCRKLESKFFQILPKPQYVRFNLDALIRADTATRFQVYKTSREIGMRSVNEIRGLEDLQPIDGGDDYAPLAAPAPGAPAKANPAAPPAPGSPLPPEPGAGEPPPEPPPAAKNGAGVRRKTWRDAIRVPAQAGK